MPTDFYDGNGAQVDFTVTFDYTAQSFVEVSVDDIVLTQGPDYTFFTPTTIRFTVAPAVGVDNVEFDRQTGTTLLVDFEAGASILDTDLDTALQQILHLAEERLDTDGVNALIAAADLDPTTLVTTFMADVLNKSTAASAQAAFGLSAKLRALALLEANADWLTELGIDGTGMQTFLFSDTLAIARSNLGVSTIIPRQNELLNSDFQVWQAKGATIGAGDNDDLDYFADQWKLISDGNDIVDIAQETASLPRGVKSAAKFTTQQVTSDKWGFYQLLENTRSKGIAGQEVSASIKVKTGAADTLNNLRLHVVTWEGAADAPTADPISAWSGLEVDDTLVVNFNTLDSVDIAATDSWQTFVLEGISVPATAENVGIMVVTHDAGWAIGDEVYVTGCKLELNDTATDFQSPSFLEELLECERFFTKTFNYDVVPAQNTNDIEGAIIARISENAGVNTAHDQWRFNVPMHSTPTVTTYNWGAANVNWRTSSDTADLALGTEFVSPQGYYVDSADGIGLSAIYAIHAAAVARFF